MDSFSAAGNESLVVMIRSFCCGITPIIQREGRWARAEQEVNRAIELDPKFAEAYHLRAKILGAVNRQDEAIE